MKLSEFIKNQKTNKEICLLGFEGYSLKCVYYHKDDKIEEDVLNMEVEEIIDEDDVLEVWIR